MEYSKEEVKKLIDPLINQIESDQFKLERYRKFMVELIEIPWYKLIFLNRSKMILDFLKNEIEHNDSDPGIINDLARWKQVNPTGFKLYQEFLNHPQN